MMKRTALLVAILALAALGLTSCQKDENTRKQQFVASFEQASNGKVSINEVLQMYWDERAIINVLGSAEDGLYEYYETFGPTSISDDSTTAVLTPTWDLPTGFHGPYFAYSSGLNSYRYNNDDESFSLEMQPLFESGEMGGEFEVFFNTMPMVAHANDFGQLQFKHLYGVLKVIIDSPDGLINIDPSLFIPRISNVSEDDYFYGYMRSCDVAWDAQGEFTMSNVTYFSTDEMSMYDRDGSIPLRYSEALTAELREERLEESGEVASCYVYYCRMPVGDIKGLKFTVPSGTGYEYQKTMSSTAVIHIERAGISTVTLNITEDDLVTGDKK